MPLFRVISVCTLLAAYCSTATSQELCSFYAKETETTPLGYTIKRTALTDSTYQLSYGKESADRVIDGYFHCDVPSFGRLSMYAENEDYIFMSAGCGTSCRTGYLLPLDSNSEIKVIHDWLEYDLTKNIIVSFDYDFDKEDMMIKVFRLDEEKETIYTAEINCERSVPVTCINKVEIEGDYIKINWYQELNTAPFIISLKD